MARAYSQDLRDGVLAAAEDGSSRSAAARFGIGIKTAIEWVRRARETGVATLLTGDVCHDACAYTLTLSV